MRLNINSSALIVVAATILLSLITIEVQAGQGCPFDDASCQEYCGQQGCQMGYCGHFAWIQCICRKCGDQWFDKVQLSDKQQVNLTELASLDLNNTMTTTTTTTTPLPPTTGAPSQSQLTLLLVPDLSQERLAETLNDIPDENSDKFLDYLAKNHERLVQATQSRQENGQSPSSQEDHEEGDELVELQISSNSNNAASSQQTTTTTTPAPQQQQQQHREPQPNQQSPVTRLLRMAVVERRSDEID